jgi:hypothetical protein
MQNAEMGVRAQECRPYGQVKPREDAESGVAIQV